MSANSALFETVIEAYEAEGFPHDVIGQWTLPKNDVDDLITAVVAAQPEKILEVGTFVGVSTLLMALASPPHARILTFDPNFPLETEMGSMGSRLGDIDARTRTQDVAAAVARRLGVADKIKFVAGGFSVGETFASKRVSARARTVIAGPAACAEFGAFDLTLIDALHYADAVESDLALALSFAKPSTRILLHDCVGMWGQNVRAGVLRCLADRPEWKFVHPPFRALYRSIGTVFRPDTHPEIAEQLIRVPTVSTFARRNAPPLARTLIEALAPRALIELVADAPSLSLDPSDVEAIDQIAVANSWTGALARKLDDLERRGIPGRDVLLFTAGALDGCTRDELRTFFALIGRAGARCAVMRTPPGEAGAATVLSEPLKVWVELANQEQAEVRAVPGLDQGHAPFLFHRDLERLEAGSAQCNLVLIASRSDTNHMALARYDTVSPAVAEEYEQRDALSAHLFAAFAQQFSDAVSAAEQLASVHRQFDDLASLHQRTSDRLTEVSADALRNQRALEVSQEALAGRIHAQHLAETSLAAAQTETRTLRDELTTLRISTGARDNEVVALKQIAASQVAEIVALRNAAEARSAELASLRAMVKANDAEAGALRGEIANLTEDKVALQRQAALLDLETKRSHAALDREKLRSAGINAELIKLQMRLEETARETAAAHRELDWRERTLNSRAAQARLARAEVKESVEAIEEALAFALARLGASRPTVMLGWTPSESEVRALLRDPRIGALGVLDSQASLFPEDICQDFRFGQYFASGTWRLPGGGDTVLFLGSVRQITRAMLTAAWRAGVRRLCARAGSTWIAIPLRSMYRLWQAFKQLQSAAMSGRHSVAQTLASSGAREILPKRLRPALMTTDECFASTIADAPAYPDYVPGRVVVVCGNLAPGGAERQVANTLVGLKAAGLNDVHFLAHYLNPGPARLDFHLERVRAAGVPAREIERVITDLNDPALPERLRATIGVLPGGLVLDIANLVLEFERAKPEIVHAWLDWDNVRSGIAAAIAGVPKIVVSGRNLAPHNFTLYQAYMDGAYRVLARHDRVRILNNSHAGATSYAEWIGCSPDRIKVLHNGLDLSGFTPPSSDARARERAALGIPADATVVGGVFRFDEEKRPLLWIATALTVAKARPDVRFLLFGQGSLQAQMEAEISAAGMNDRFMLAGVTTTPLKAMALMDVFMLVSHGEGLPNVLIEAQATGAAVVATKVGGAPETVEEGVTGWIVDTSAPNEIAARVLTLIDDPSSLKRARTEGPRLVNERFGLDKMIRETLDVYGLDLSGSMATSPPALSDAMT